MALIMQGRATPHGDLDRTRSGHGGFFMCGCGRACGLSSLGYVPLCATPRSHVNRVAPYQATLAPVCRNGA